MSDPSRDDWYGQALSVHTGLGPGTVLQCLYRLENCGLARVAVGGSRRSDTRRPVVVGAGVLPLFVSHRRLAAQRRRPRAATNWALDSGGFTELRLQGAWRTKAAESAGAVRRYC